MRYQDIVQGEQYIVTKNRSSEYGQCKDLIDIEGQLVTVHDFSI